MTTLLVVASALGQSARLELRIVPQSGVPGLLCVYDDPPTPLGSFDPPREAWVSPNIAKRFEVQYRLVDIDVGDDLVPRGLRSVSIDIATAAASAGLWGRGLLSVGEGEPGVDSGSPPDAVDCSGLPIAPVLRKRGLHQPYRGALSGADPSEDADNGAFQPQGLTAITALTIGPPGQAPGAWFGLYTFEFTPASTFAGSLTITAALAASPSTTFQWYDSLGVIHTATSAAAAIITVRAPATPVACCSRGRCAIGLSPSACFASAGFIASGSVCGPTPTSTCCFGDFNRDGVVGVQDVFDFIIAYLRGSLLADVNGSGTLTVQDVFDFLGAYFGGCG